MPGCPGLALYYSSKAKSFLVIMRLSTSTKRRGRTKTLPEVKNPEAITHHVTEFGYDGISRKLSKAVWARSKADDAKLEAPF